MEELRADIEELQSLMKTASRAKVKDILNVEIRKLQTELTRRLEKSSNTGNVTEGGGEAIDMKPEKVTTIKTARYVKNLDTYAWDQSDKFMKIYVTLNGVQNLDTSNITAQFTDTSVKMNVSNLDGKDYQLHIAHLMEDITPSASYHKVKTDMVLLMCKKVEEKKTWPYVTKRERDLKEKDKPKFDETKDPNQSLMDMMKKMYDEGDDEMKRTIGKAMTEAQEKRGAGQMF